ncbi:MAG: SRPBCC family protein [archaeon]|nr:SRPBCC family protein [archaeon]
MKTKTIKQNVSFKASPHEVFEALMDEKKHAGFTGAKAKISRKINGKFSVYDNGIFGKTIELEKDKKIVQEWYCEDENWPEGHFSKLIITFAKSGTGTKLSMVHEKVPEGAAKSIALGWKDYYWKPMKEMLEK